METFSVFDAAVNDQADQWLSLWSNWNSREVFAHPEYVKLFARECDRALCAVLKGPSGAIILPVILRPLSTEVWSGQDNNKYYDVVTPYGFGGPYKSGNCDTTVFWREFERWAANMGVVSSFFRLSPFAADMRNVFEVKIMGGNVIRSLTEGTDSIWDDYDPEVRRHIRRAQDFGLAVEVDETGERIDDFFELYHSTMKRLNALNNYFFSYLFFQRFIHNLQGQFVFFHVKYKENIIASSLSLVSQDNIYAFLLGADKDAFKMYPNEFFHHATINWGIRQGKKRYILGGGYNGYDGIFHFKKRFAPRSVVPFEIGRRIHNEAEYKALCKIRQEYEEDRGRQWDVNSTYFPGYRRPGDS
jgi:hypothetical protein